MVSKSYGTRKTYSFIQFQMISLYRGHVWELKNNLEKTRRFKYLQDLQRYTFGEYRYNEKGEKLKDIVLNTIKNSLL